MSTENKSAMERLAEVIGALGSIHSNTPLHEAARAVLAEHDAAQSVPPSERAHAWSNAARQKLADFFGVKLTHGGERTAKLDAVLQPILEDGRRMMLPDATPPSEAAKAWRFKMVGAIGTWGELPPGDDKYEAYHSKVCPLLDEAVRLMSQQPAEAPKRLLVDNGGSMLKHAARAVLREHDAALKVAPEPDTKSPRDGFLNPMTDSQHRILTLEQGIKVREEQLDRANAIINALLALVGRKPW